MYAYIGRDNVDLFSSLYEAIEYGYTPSELVNVIAFAKNTEIDPRRPMIGLATALICYADKVAVLVMTGGALDEILEDHWHAVVSAFAVLLDRVAFGDAEIRIATAAGPEPIEPIKLLLPPELPF